MQTTIIKLGNSQGIQLPNDFLQTINVSENDTVDVLLQNNSIIIRKTPPRIHRTTEERLRDFFGEEYNEIIMKQEEINWGKAEGEEVW
jgi:antitoxin component of MazEF toxin-antitoxin module